MRAFRVSINNNVISIPTTRNSLREKCPYSELFWSVFSLNRTEYGETLCISPYSVRMRENKNQNNSEYGHFSRSDFVVIIYASYFADRLKS